MFLLNEILVVTPGRRKEALERLAWIHGLMASKPGFRLALVGRYLGDGARHTVLRIWESEETFRRFREGPDGTYGRTRPEGLYRNETVAPRWNGTLEPAEFRAAGLLVKLQQTVSEEAWEAFGEYQRRLKTLLRAAHSAQQSGPTGVSEFRATDRPESLIIARFGDRSDFERLLDDPDYASVLASAPEGSGPLTTQCFEVMDQTGPQ